MLTTDDAYARSEAGRLVLAMFDDDEATLEAIWNAAAKRPDGHVALALALARLVYEGAVGAAGDRWREPLALTIWSATPDEPGTDGADEAP